jgi:hypothetical protein
MLSFQQMTEMTIDRVAMSTSVVESDEWASDC